MASGHDDQRVVIGVYADRAAATAAAEAARAAGATTATIGSASDTTASLRAEMRDELTSSAAAPGSVGPVTKEMTKGIGVLVPVCALIGAVVAIPLAFIEMGDLGFWGRLLIVMGCGILAGGVVGLVLGGALASSRAGRSAAAQRGVTVSVTPGTEEVAAAMTRLRPIRLDIVDPTGRPVDTLESEDRHVPGGTVETLGRNLDADDHDRRA